MKKFNLKFNEVYCNQNNNIKKISERPVHIRRGNNESKISYRFVVVIQNKRAQGQSSLFMFLIVRTKVFKPLINSSRLMNRAI